MFLKYWSVYRGVYYKKTSCQCVSSSVTSSSDPFLMSWCLSNYKRETLVVRLLQNRRHTFYTLSYQFVVVRRLFLYIVSFVEDDEKHPFFSLKKRSEKKRSQNCSLTSSVKVTMITCRSKSENPSLMNHLDFLCSITDSLEKYLH